MRTHRACVSRLADRVPRLTPERDRAALRTEGMRKLNEPWAEAARNGTTSPPSRGTRPPSSEVRRASDLNKRQPSEPWLG
jgi:hypothetical protein